MPIVSVCPYCNRGRVRASEDALGTTAKCPACGSEFTVIPTEESALNAAGSLSPSSASSVPSVYAQDAPPRRSAPPPAAEPPAAETPPDGMAAPAPVPAKAADEVDPADLPDPARLPGMVAAAVALAGAVCWVIPDFGRLVWLGLAIVAGALGGWAVLAADRKRLFAWIGLGAAGGSLLLCLLLPWMLGEGWWPERGYNSDEAVAIGETGEQTDGRKPVAAVTGMWFKDGVRVQVVEVRREAVTVTTLSGKKQTRTTVPDVFQVVVEVSNDAAPRPVAFGGWTDAHPSVFRTTGATDIPVRKFDGAVDGGPPAKPLLLTSGLSARQTLYFVPPPDGAGGQGQLDLPPAAFGGTGDPVRFTVPFRTMKPLSHKPGGPR